MKCIINTFSVTCFAKLSIGKKNCLQIISLIYIQKPQKAKYFGARTWESCGSVFLFACPACIATALAAVRTRDLMPNDIKGAILLPRNFIMAEPSEVPVPSPVPSLYRWSRLPIISACQRKCMSPGPMEVDKGLGSPHRVTPLCSPEG